jgi:importin-5
MLLVCGKNSGTLTNEMVTATLSQLVNCIAAEGDSSFLASLYKCFRQSMLVIGGPSSITPQIHDGIMEATRRQLQSLADKRKARAAKLAQDIEEEKEDLMLVEEMEDFALEDMGKMLATFNESHELLIAVSSVRDLGLGLVAYDEEEGEEGGIVN